MPLVYYWRPDNYFHDLDYGVGYHLNQANPLLHQIDLGDSLWAITRNRQGHYVLAAELVVKARTENQPGFRYGRYRVWGDLRTSRYFQVDEQPRMEQVIRSLSPRIEARYLGQSFQGYSAVRRLTDQDHLILAAASQNLPLEPRARLLPEERLEAVILLGDPVTVEHFISAEHPGIAEQRQAYLYGQAPSRNQRLAAELQELYSGQCQICLWHPRQQYQQNLCEGHHIHWLSRGGEDSLENLMLVCPNHHSAIHRLDAPLDYRDLCLDFGSHREKVLLNNHL